VDVGVLAAGGLGLLDGLVEGGHEIEDLARLLGLRSLGKGLLFPLRLNDLRQSVGVGVGELGAIEVVLGHAVDERERLLDLLFRHRLVGRVEGGRIADYGQRIACRTIASSRSRSSPRRSRPDHAYLAIATLDDLSRAWRSSLYGLGGDPPASPGRTDAGAGDREEAGDRRSVNCWNSGRRCPRL
jgi:hypothetical protein